MQVRVVQAYLHGLLRVGHPGQAEGRGAFALLLIKHLGLLGDGAWGWKLGRQEEFNGGQRHYQAAAVLFAPGTLLTNFTSRVEETTRVRSLRV